MADFLETLKTLTGMLLSELQNTLDEELPEKAYSSVPGAAGLTDIQPAWMIEYFNKYLGLSGLGWGLDYEPDAMTITAEKRQSSSRERTVYCAILKKAIFWYIVTDEQGNRSRCEINTSGGSENDIVWYALKGAITNAIGNAGSKIGWQSSVYKGIRSHDNVGSQKGKKSERFQHASADSSRSSATVTRAQTTTNAAAPATPAPVKAVAAPTVHAPAQVHAPSTAPVASVAAPAAPAAEIHPSPTMGTADPAPAAPASAAAVAEVQAPAAVATPVAPPAPKKAWRDTRLDRSDGPFANMIHAGKAAGIHTYGVVAPTYVHWCANQTVSPEDKKIALECLAILAAEHPADFPAEWMQ